jgi:hypothetical protein
MKYIKTFESYSVNETQDMMFMPVDPIKGINDVLADIKEATFQKVKEKVEANFDTINRYAGSLITDEQSESIASILEEVLGKSRFEMTYDDITLSNIFEVAKKIGGELVDSLKEKIGSVFNRIFGNGPVMESSAAGGALLIAFLLIVIVNVNINNSVIRAKDIQSGGWNEEYSGGKYYYTKGNKSISSKYKVRNLLTKVGDLFKGRQEKENDSKTRTLKKKESVLKQPKEGRPSNEPAVQMEYDEENHMFFHKDASKEEREAEIKKEKEEEAKKWPNGRWKQTK